MAPIARAFSTTDPRATATVLKPFVLLEMELLYKTAAAPAAITSTPVAINPLRMFGVTLRDLTG
jgi:hypothetical protein